MEGITLRSTGESMHVPSEITDIADEFFEKVSTREGLDAAVESHPFMRPVGVLAAVVQYASMPEGHPDEDYNHDRAYLLVCEMANRQRPGDPFTESKNELGDTLREKRKELEYAHSAPTPKKGILGRIRDYLSSNV